MTVNERLVALGTLEAFDHAQATRNVGEIERLLKEAHVDEPSIKKIVKEQKAGSWKKQKLGFKFGQKDRGKWQAILANAVLQPTRKAACWLRERSRRAAEQRC